jgi:hypothetical protein
MIAKFAVQIGRGGGAHVSGLLGAEFDICAAAAPISGDGLGLQGRFQIVLLRAARENVAGQPDLVPYVYPTAGTHLVGPLPWDDFATGAYKDSRLHLLLYW